MPKPRKPRSETQPMPALFGVATLAAESANAETRTIDVTFYSGAVVLRQPFFDDPFELEFEVTPKAAMLGRLRAGASVLNSHSSYDVGDVLGVTEDAWISKDGKAQARLFFSRRADVEPIWQDVQDGVLRSVSMGVNIHALEEVTEEGAELKRYRATSWEPFEISLVGVPADAGAQFMDAKAGDAPCRITHSAEASANAQPGDNMQKIKVRLLADTEDGLSKAGEIIEILASDFDAELHSKDVKPKRTEPAVRTTTLANDPKADDRALEDAIEADKARRARIVKAAEYYEMDAAWVERHVRLGSSIELVKSDAEKIRARQAPVDPSIRVGEDRDSAAWRSDRLAEALVARATSAACPEPARQYANHTFVEAAYECLSFQGRHKRFDPRRHRSEIIELALHSTDDFPLILADALNKVLLPAYELAQANYRLIAQQRPFSDFRPHRFTRSGDFPVPLQVNEHGEFKYGTMGESQETVSLATFGRIIGFTRQSLINDDLGAFRDLGSQAARRVVDFENAHFFTNVILVAAGLGPDLSDTVAVYDAAHGNLTGAGALSNALLESAMALMMAQTGLDGLKLNVMPKYCLVSPTNLGLARRLLAVVNPTQASEVNLFAGEIEPIADANLTGTRFYVLADPSRLANYVYGYLGESQGPRTQVREGFEIDGVEFKIALDFAVGAIDHRGGVTGAGA